MSDSLSATALWEQQQRIAATRAERAGREYRKNFLLVVAFLVLTLAVAIAVSRMSLDGTRLS